MKISEDEKNNFAQFAVIKLTIKIVFIIDLKIIIIPRKARITQKFGIINNR